MASENNVVTRRNLFKWGLGAAGAIITTRTLADVCSPVTGLQPLGPFFPDPNTPEDVVREDLDPKVPLHLANDNDLTFVKGRSGKATGQVVYIRGKISTESCQPISNAMLVIWQATHSGRYNHTGDTENHDFRHPKTGEVLHREMDPYFQCWGKATTSADGEYLFKTVVPGFYPADLEGGWYRPPHIHFMVSATGFPQLVTQMYFKGSQIDNNDWIQELNEKDLLLQSKQITREQKEKLVVEFKQEAIFKDGLVGEFNITLTR